MSGVLFVLVRDTLATAVRARHDESCLTQAAELLSVSARGVAFSVLLEDGTVWRCVASGRACRWLAAEEAARHKVLVVCARAGAVRPI